MKLSNRLGKLIKSVWTECLSVEPLRMWVLILAGPVLTLCAATLVYIVWKGGWPLSLRDKQLNIIGIALFATLALLALIFTKIAGMKATASGPLGTKLELDGTDDEDERPVPGPGSTTVNVNQGQTKP